MDPFHRTMTFVLEWEGGYVNDPDDPGGETKYGIAKRYHPDIDIRNLTAEKAKEIYRRDYWERARCHKLPPRVATAMMDTAVNLGTRRAAELLQRALKIPDDGIIGEQTISAAQGDRNAPNKLIAERLRYYAEKCVESPVKLKYMRGWSARCIALVHFIGP